jgi:hypothetical protein
MLFKFSSTYKRDIDFECNILFNTIQQLSFGLFDKRHSPEEN